MDNSADGVAGGPNVELDKLYMRRCLELAFRAEGQTSPNPLVGCVVLDKDGEVVGEGYHARAGENHAEVNALNAAGSGSRGGTLYCSLEPCCHHGRTPPCSDAVIRSGVSRVVVGLGDPNPKVGGGGLSALRQAGIEVVTGILEAECRFQNRAFLKSITKSLPWVSLKMAVTLDGKIADRNGHSKWITSAAAREQVMLLRSQCDAIMIGAGTARADNPSLTVRNLKEFNTDLLDAAGGASLFPRRVLIDPTLSVAPEANLFRCAEQFAETLVFCHQDKSLWKRSPSDYPVHVEVVPVSGQAARAQDQSEDKPEDGQSCLDIEACLKELHSRRINRVLCEGGGLLAGNLLDSELVDELYWFVAPKILGDNLARASVVSGRVKNMLDVQLYAIREHKVFAPDILIHALIREP